jgi:hypothetical protein
VNVELGTVWNVVGGTWFIIDGSFLPRWIENDDGNNPQLEQTVYGVRLKPGVSGIQIRVITVQQ